MPMLLIARKPSGAEAGKFPGKFANITSAYVLAPCVAKPKLKPSVIMAMTKYNRPLIYHGDVS